MSAEGATTRRLTLVAAALAVAMAAFSLLAFPAFGADSGVVAAKVSVAAPCISLASSTVDFGTLGFSTASTPVQGDGTSIVSNCGSAAENVAAKGADAVGPSGATWALVARTQPSSPCDFGTNKFVLKAEGYDSTWTTLLNGFDLTPTNQTLVNAAAGGQVNIDYDLWMPCSGSSGAGETMSFEIVYTASL